MNNFQYIIFCLYRHDYNTIVFAIEIIIVECLIIDLNIYKTSRVKSLIAFMKKITRGLLLNSNLTNIPNLM